MAAMTEYDEVSNNDIYTEVQPAVLSFGCVSAGFVYKLQVAVANKGPRPQMLKVSMVPEEGEKNRMKSNFIPLKIAPGVKQSFSLDLYADEAMSTTFYMVVEQSVNRMTIRVPVKALVVPIDVFRHVAKSLTLQKRPIYRSGVTVMGAVGMNDDSRSVVTGGGASVLSEAIMDEADIEELVDLPLVDGLYFDSHNGHLKFDSKLAEVYVDGDMSMEESVRKTREMRNRHLDELEDQGFHVGRSVSATSHRMASGRNSPSSGLGQPSLDEFSSVIQSNSFAEPGED
jgi:hypothetical protein